MKYDLKLHRLRARQARSQEQGFTIIELMIALSIISVILVISTVVLINLGLLYTKGNNQANTQNTARNIVNELASQLELGSADPIIGANVICMGSQRYSFATNVELSSSNTGHALWRDTMKSSATCAAVTDMTNPGTDLLAIPGSGAELLSPQMELTDFSITQPATPNGTYIIKVTVAYGDPTLHTTANGKTNCTGDKGTQYCAVSSLTQVVARRVPN